MRVVKRRGSGIPVPSPWMHLDFVIFNKFESAPLLAIEVDGIAHHEQNEKQKERDSIKSEAIFVVGCFSRLSELRAPV